MSHDSDGDGREDRLECGDEVLVCRPHLDWLWRGTLARNDSTYSMMTGRLLDGDRVTLDSVPPTIIRWCQTFQ